MKVKRLMKKTGICLLSLVMILPFFYLQNPTVEAKEDGNGIIYMNTDNIITKDFEGFGVQWDPSDLYDYTDEQWNSFYEKAEFLKPNIMRVMLHDGDSYCIGFEDDGTPIYDWESVMMKRVYKILDFAEANNVPIILGEWRSISERGYLSYDEYGKTVNWSSPTWARMIVDCLEHLIVDKGYTCIKYYNMINEPNYYKRDNGGTDEESYNNWKTAMKNLRQEMDNSGIEAIENIKIVGPDVYDGQEAWIKQAKSEDLKDIIEMTEIHRYAPKSEVESGLIETKLKNWRTVAEELDENVKNEGFGIGEMGLSGTGPGDCQLNGRKYEYGVDIFDYALQAMRAGMKFGSVWGFEDSMHVQHNDIVNTFKDQYGPAASTEEGRQYKVHTPTGDPNIDNDIKIWGFWNELGEEMAAQNAENNVTGRANTVKASDEQLKPWYYTWSMLCRYFPSGMQILETTDSGIDYVRATSGIINRGNNQADLSIAVVNTSNKEQTITLNVPNASGKATLNQYYYYDGDRPMNDKGQLEVYDTLENVDLAKGLEVTMSANTCMIFTTLGHERESNPITLTTGQTPAVTGVDIYEQSNLDKITVGQTYQMETSFTPSISKAEMRWKVTDYFGNETDIATIDQDGKLVANRAGQFNVTGYIKDNPQISDTVTFVATTTKTLLDDLENLDVAISYQDVVHDDNSANFNNAKTIKRSDSDPNGKPGIITYKADGIFDFELKAYSRKSSLGSSGNFTVQVSKDGNTWEDVELNFEVQDQLSSSWYPFVITPKEMDRSVEWQYLRVIMRSVGYNTYDPQYGGGTILYGEQSASEIVINNQEDYVVKGETLQFDVSVLPQQISQEVVYSVVETNEQATSKATIDENGLLTAKETGNVVVVIETKDKSLAAYYPLQIVGGYFVDEINNFDLMYDYGSFTYENSPQKFGEILIKRTSDTPQSIVYAYKDIQKATFEVFSNSSFGSDQASIYMSKDGIHYDLLDATITKVGTAPGASDFSKYTVSATGDNQYNFVKFEIKNDSKIYNPMIAKAEIIYNQEDDDVISMNVVQDRITLNVGKQTQLDVKAAPLNGKPELTFASENPEIATIDDQGLITAKSTGTTYLTVTLKDKQTIKIPINVLEENLAYKKDISATSEYNKTDKAASLAVDGDYSSRWGSAYMSSGSVSITVDLGKVQTIDTVKLYWETARATDYNVEVAGEDKAFKVVQEMRDITDGTDDVVNFDPVDARYVRITGLTPANKYGYSIYELEVYDNSKIVNVDSVNFTDTTKELYVGQEEELQIQVVPENATYPLPIYSSSDENVVRIENGKMIAVKAGKATISANVDGKIATLEVNVVEENAQKIADSITDLTIYDNKVVLPVYDKYTLSLYSSDHEKIIDLDGNVNLPVYDTTVNLVVKVVDQNNQEAYSKPISINIAGNDDSLENINNLLDEVKNIDESLYKPSTVKNLKDAINSVEQILTTKDLLVSELNDAATLLNQAYQGLELKEDQTTLQKLIAEIKGLDSKLYTEKSYQSLMEIVKEVEDQINDDSSKEEIANAIAKLQEGYQQLIKQDDYDLLKQKIEEIEKIDWDLYTSQSQAQLKESLEKAKQYLQSDQMTTQGIYECYYELVQSYGKLQLKADLTTLKALIEKIENLDLSLYKQESVDHLKAVLKEVKEKMRDDLTPEECQALLSKLQNAYNGLQLKENAADNSIASKTGDSSNVSLYATVGIGSLIGVMICLNKKRKYYKN